MNCAILEVVSSLAETLGMQQKTEEQIQEDESVAGLFNRLSAKYPRFSQMVFDVREQKILDDGVLIFFNGMELSLKKGVNTKLNNGDVLTIVPLVRGG